MKLPRWLVILMLTSSVLAVLAAAGWWWVTWPERTAREFVGLLLAGRIEDAKSIYAWKPDELYTERDIQEIALFCNRKTLKENSRPLSDLLFGRKSFWMRGPHDLKVFLFEVERGNVMNSRFEDLEIQFPDPIDTFGPVVDSETTP